MSFITFTFLVFAYLVSVLGFVGIIMTEGKVALSILYLFCLVFTLSILHLEMMRESRRYLSIDK